MKNCEDINNADALKCRDCSEYFNCKSDLFNNLSEWIKEVLIDENSELAKEMDAVAQL